MSPFNYAIECFFTLKWLTSPDLLLISTQQDFSGADVNMQNGIVLNETKA